MSSGDWLSPPTSRRTFLFNAGRTPAATLWTFSLFAVFQRVPAPAGGAAPPLLSGEVSPHPTKRLASCDQATNRLPHHAKTGRDVDQAQCLQHSATSGGGWINIIRRRSFPGSPYRLADLKKNKRPITCGRTALSAIPFPGARSAPPLDARKPPPAHARHRQQPAPLPNPTPHPHVCLRLVSFFAGLRHPA